MSRLSARAFGLALSLCLLSGCAAPVVVGHCELPEALAAKSEALDPVTAGMSLQSQREQWVKDRAHAAASDQHADALIDYVAAKCQ